MTKACVGFYLLCLGLGISVAQNVNTMPDWDSFLSNCLKTERSEIECSEAHRYWYELKDYYFQNCCLGAKLENSNDNCEHCIKSAIVEANEEFKHPTIEQDPRSALSGGCHYRASPNSCIKKPLKPIPFKPIDWVSKVWNILF